MNKVVILFAVLFSIAIISCDEKEKNEDILSATEEALSIAEDEVVSLKSDAEITEDEDMIAMAEVSGEMPADPSEPMHFFHHMRCGTVTADTIDEFPKEIVIDFGDGCTGRRGEVRTGKIVISITDSMHLEGATRTVTYVDVYVGDTKIEKSKTVTNLGMNEDGNWVIEMASESTVTNEDGSVVSHAHNETQEWISGFGTPEIEDDVFYKSGSGTINKNGDEFTKTITEPLLIDRTCLYPKSGVTEITNEEGTSVINYGDGECDDIATVTKDGITEEINLSMKRIKGPRHGDKGHGRGHGGKGPGQHGKNVF